MTQPKPADTQKRDLADTTTLLAADRTLLAAERTYGRGSGPGLQRS
jgi:uncharacterized membrane protein YidH (DUF202 family)